MLRDYEIELTEAKRQYETECQKEAWRSGWLKPQDFFFSGKGSQDWVKRREGASYRKNEVVVPVRLPNALFRWKSASRSSGRLSAAAVRYRRLKTAFIRGLYFQPIIRSHHMTEYNGAPDSEAKIAGEKRKRDSAEGSEGGSAADSGAGAEVAAEPRINDTSSECRKKSRRGRPPKSKGSSDEKKRREAAVSAFL